MAKNISKAKEKSSFQEKMKNFFGFKGPTPINLEKVKTEIYSLTAENIKDISKESSLNHRLKALKELYQVVRTRHLDENAVEALCCHTKDMIDSQLSTETRHIVLHFYAGIIVGQLEKLNIMRTYFFMLIKKHNISEDILPRLELLKALTENGKKITYFENDIGPFLLEWLPDIIAAGKASEIFPLLVHLISFNAAYLDDHVIEGFIKHTCSLCGKTNNEDDLQMGMDVMDAVLCYSHLPSAVLQHFIVALCLTVNIEKFSRVSWKHMGNLLGTSLGHTSIFTLCSFLQDRNSLTNYPLLRGAVFFIGMALWGSKKVPYLMHPPSAVLPSFHKALECNSTVVAYEIVLSVQRLVKKSGNQLQLLTWNIILDIIERVLQYPDLQSSVQPAPILATSLHDLITVVEECNIDMSCDRLFKIIEGCSDSRDEESIIRLISYKAQSIQPIKDDFISNMNHLLEKYFKNESRQAVQLKVLDVLCNARYASGHLFEDDLIDQTILLYMPHLDLVPNEIVRKVAVTLLIEIAEHCITKRFFEILDIIEKVMKRPFDTHPENTFSYEIVPSSNKQGTFVDIEAAVAGLIRIFERKLHFLPSSHCVYIYNVLVSHITSHYQYPIFVEEGATIRRMILEFILRLRTNARKQIGLLVDDKEEYSVYIICVSKEKCEANIGAPNSPPPGSPSFFSSTTMSYISYYEAFQALITCIKEEKDWRVLELCLRGLPRLLQNKALIISGCCPLKTLCSALSSIVQDKSSGMPESLINTPSRFTRTDLHAHVYPVLAALVSYQSGLETHLQRMLINSLQSGLVSRSAKICIEGLTLCILEMRNMMLKLLPAVLLKLSKISATVGVAVSVLEFLSNLIRLPQMYVNFVEDQYMAIFAIALPYTNPFKFNQYTVILAHHVIAMWFLKCRIPFRKEFAKFITKGLRSNITIPFEEKQTSLNQNVDASQKENVDSDSVEKQQSVNKSIQALHRELMETGIDLMARFTFGMSSNVPKRSAVSEFLLDKGQKSSWLVGNKIVTITTSGCGTKAFKYGLCEKCYATCREMSKSMESEENETVFPLVSEKVDSQSDKRRRHRSAVQQRRSTLSHELQTSRLRTKDDIVLHRPDVAFEEPFSGSDAFSPNSGDLFSTYEENSDDKDKKYKRHLCSCWCSSWAEIHIRRPTGNTSWMMKIQNRLFLPSSPPEIPLPVITSLLLPHKEESFEDEAPEQENFQEAASDDAEDMKIETDETTVTDKESSALGSSSEALACPKSNSPLRRTNSSPDMNTGWVAASCGNMEDSVRQHFIHKTDPVYETVTPCVTDLLNKSERTPSDASEKGEAVSSKSVNFVGDTLSSRLSRDSHVESTRDSTKTKETEQKPDLKLDLSLESSFGSSRSSLYSSGERCGSLSASVVNSNIGFSSSNNNSFRDRAQTITVMSPIHPNHNKPFESAPQKPPKDMHRSGMSPSFIFLQLYHNSFFGPSAQKPLMLYPTEIITRAIRVLDRIPPYDTHKIGVIYVGPGQVDNEVEILNNLYGSIRYVSFLRGLGTLIRLSEVDLQSTYVGGLDIKGEDGKFALIWHDDVMQVVFHVATLMPNKKSDVCRNSKKLHIANDFVTIVYNESGEEYKLSTIASQVTSACVIIRPEDFQSNVVTVKAKTDKMMEIFGHTDAYIVSDESLPIFVRQLALHANLASLIMSRQRFTQCSNDPHVSNWLERLRKIKVLRTKVIEERKTFFHEDNLSSESPSTESLFVDDFTDYV